MKFQPYPRYKDSGIEWLGEIPNEWTIKRLGHISAQEKNAFVDGPFGSDLKTVDYKDDGIPLIQLNNIKEGEHVLQKMKFITEAKKEQLFRHIAKFGDVVIAKMADPVARATLVNNHYEEYVIVADCVKMTPNNLKINKEFLIYSINSKNVRTGAELVSTGITRIRINLAELKKLWIPYPPIQEQTAIANFLDRETLRIDALVEEKNRFIELLKEKRQALISHVVTKGLDPTVKMKDSGVDWLGEVPVGWKVTTLKRDFKVKLGKMLQPILKNEDDLLLPYIRASNVQPFGIDISDVKEMWINPNEISGLRLEDGDLLVSEGGDVGRCAIWKSELPEIYFQNSINRVRALKNNNIIYLSYLLRSIKTSGAIDVICNRLSIAHLTAEKLNEIVILIPEALEQTAIANFLDSETTKIDALITETQQSIALLKEHRAALISAAVTGKIDVREFINRA